MKLLSVANVGTIMGGTGACALSCVKALPDWEHSVVFLSGWGTGLKGQFGCDVRFQTSVTPQLIEDVRPDVILFHNTAANKMPAVIPADVLTVYYQHSAALACREARRRCDLFLTVSKHLARLAGIDEKFVLYQPVPCPPPSSEPRRPLTFGRLCTPNAAKWKGQDAFYRELSAAFMANVLAFNPLLGQAVADFVGAPDDFQPYVEGVGRRIPASWQARSLLHEWAAMLYHHPDITETYGRTVCEAQRAGCIPIVDNRGGFVEQIQHGRTGFLCSNVNEFADALYRALSGTHGIDIPAMVAAGNARGSLEVWRRNFLRWVGAAASVKA